MTPRQVTLVRDSFTILVPQREALAAAFYARLFALDPALRPLFRGDLRAQGAKLVAALATVVRSLDRLDAVLDSVRALGRRHAGYGVRDEHYATVGAALVATLREHLGEAFDEETEAAWTTAYAALSGVMREAARQPLAA